MASGRSKSTGKKTSSTKRKTTSNSKSGKTHIQEIAIQLRKALIPKEMARKALIQEVLVREVHLQEIQEAIHRR